MCFKYCSLLHKNNAFHVSTLEYKLQRTTTTNYTQIFHNCRDLQLKAAIRNTANTYSAVTNFCFSCAHFNRLREARVKLRRNDR